MCCGLGFTGLTKEYVVFADLDGPPQIALAMGATWDAIAGECQRVHGAILHFVEDNEHSAHQFGRRSVTGEGRLEQLVIRRRV